MRCSTADAAEATDAAAAADVADAPRCRLVKERSPKCPGGFPMGRPRVLSPSPSPSPTRGGISHGDGLASPIHMNRSFDACYEAPLRLFLAPADTDPLDMAHASTNAPIAGLSAAAMEFTPRHEKRESELEQELEEELDIIGRSRSPFARVVCEQQRRTSCRQVSLSLEKSKKQKRMRTMQHHRGVGLHVDSDAEFEEAMRRKCGGSPVPAARYRTKLPKKRRVIREDTGFFMASLDACPLRNVVRTKKVAKSLVTLVVVAPVKADSGSAAAGSVGAKKSAAAAAGSIGSKKSAAAGSIGSKKSAAAGSTGSKKSSAAGPAGSKNSAAAGSKKSTTGAGASALKASRMSKTQMDLMRVRLNLVAYKRKSDERGDAGKPVIDLVNPKPLVQKRMGGVVASVKRKGEFAI